MIKLEPKINWIPFDKCTPPADLCSDTQYLIFLREDDYDDGATWTYSVDVATPYGRYLDNFWETEHDWKEGQRVEVLAYAEMPYMQHEEELVRSDIDKQYFTKHETKECPCCKGTGMSVPENKCGYCDGKGVIEND